MPQTASDTGTFEELLPSASPIDDLQSIAPLILDLDTRTRVLATFDGPRRLEAEVIFQCAARLTEMTGWPEEELLEALGCEIRTYGKFTGVDLPALERCRKFMGLATRGAGLVEQVSDRRQVVAGSARLLKAIGGDVDELERHLRAKVDGYTAIDFIRLGEIETASEQVRRLAGQPGIGIEAAEDDPFSEVPAPHLSTTRLQMLLESREDQLGLEVARHMQYHLDSCGTCREAYDYLRTRS